MATVATVATFSVGSFHPFPALFYSRRLFVGSFFRANFGVASAVQVRVGRTAQVETRAWRRSVVSAAARALEKGGTKTEKRREPALPSPLAISSEVAASHWRLG